MNYTIGQSVNYQTSHSDRWSRGKVESYGDNKYTVRDEFDKRVTVLVPENRMSTGSTSHSF